MQGQAKAKIKRRKRKGKLSLVSVPPSPISSSLPCPIHVPPSINQNQTHHHHTHNHQPPPEAAKLSFSFEDRATLHWGKARKNKVELIWQLLVEKGGERARREGAKVGTRDIGVRWKEIQGEKARARQGTRKGRRKGPASIGKGKKNTSLMPGLFHGSELKDNRARTDRHKWTWKHERRPLTLMHLERGEDERKKMSLMEWKWKKLEVITGTLPCHTIGEMRWRVKRWRWLTPQASSEAWSPPGHRQVTATGHIPGTSSCHVSTASRFPCRFTEWSAWSRSVVTRHDEMSDSQEKDEKKMCRHYRWQPFRRQRVCSAASRHVRHTHHSPPRL